MSPEELRARQELAAGLDELDVDSFADQSVETATAESALQTHEKIDNTLRNTLAELEAERGGREKMIDELSDFGVSEDSSLTDILIAQEMRRNIQDVTTENRARKDLDDAYSQADPEQEKKGDVAKELKDFKFHQAKNGFHLDVRHIGEGTFMIMAVREKDVGKSSGGKTLPLTGEGMASVTFKPENHQVLYNIVDSLSRDMETAENIYEIQQDILTMTGDLKMESVKTAKKPETAASDSADDSPEITVEYAEDAPEITIEDSGDSADDYPEITIEGEGDNQPETKVA